MGECGPSAEQGERDGDDCITGSSISAVIWNPPRGRGGVSCSLCGEEGGGGISFSATRCFQWRRPPRKPGKIRGRLGHLKASK